MPLDRLIVAPMWSRSLQAEGQLAFSDGDPRDFGIWLACVLVSAVFFVVSLSFHIAGNFKAACAAR